PGARRALPGDALCREPAQARGHSAARGTGAPCLTLCGRQSRGHFGHAGRARRDADLADLRRQFQSAPAQHSAAVRAGEIKKAAYAAFCLASLRAFAEVTRRFSASISGLSLLSLVLSR